MTNWRLLQWKRARALIFDCALLCLVLGYLLSPVQDKSSMVDVAFEICAISTRLLMRLCFYCSWLAAFVSLFHSVSSFFHTRNTDLRGGVATLSLSPTTALILVVGLCRWLWTQVYHLLLSLKLLVSHCTTVRKDACPWGFRKLIVRSCCLGWFTAIEIACSNPNARLKT